MTGRRRWRNSLRSRVALATGLLLTVVLVVAALALLGWTRRSLTQDVEADLRDQVNEVRILARTSTLPAVLQATGTRTGQVQVIDGAGTVIAASIGLATRDRLDVVAAPVGDATTEATVDSARLGRRAGDSFLVLARSVPGPNGPLVVYGASSLRAADRAVRALTISFLTGVPVILLIASVLLWRAVGRALLPVDQLSREVNDIESASLDRRVTAPASDDEIGRLAHTLNGLLDRLDAAARRERRFAADASHELRSPLAAARTQLEVGLAYPDRTDWPDTARDVLLELTRLEALARDLLTMAKSTDTPRRSERIDLDDIVAEVLRTLPETTVTIEHHPAGSVGAIVDGDHELLLRAVRNLAANALRHATRQIVLTVATDRRFVTVTATNDGPTIPADQHERIFEPFTRLDDARSTDEGGAGLGLAIARQIAVDHAGSLVSDPVARGTSFTLRLPLAPIGP